MKTASLSNSSVAAVAGILDPDVAFAFDLECADILNEWEMEREFEKEKRQLELLTGQKIAAEFGAPPENKSSVERW